MNTTERSTRKKKYRVKSLGYINYHVIEKKVKFLWFTWWTTVWDDKGEYETTFPLYFDSLDEAIEKLEELKLL